MTLSLQLRQAITEKLHLRLIVFKALVNQSESDLKELCSPDTC